MPELPLLILPLASPRLTLREFRPDDHDAVHAYGADPEVVRYMPWGPNTAEDTRAALERCAVDAVARPRVEYAFAIVPTGGPDAPVGSVGLHIRNPDDGVAEIGWVLRRDAWGRGIGCEAARAVMAAAFADLGLTRIWATCDARNAGSWRIMEKLGMRREAHLRRDRRIRGEWRDTLLYARLATDP